MPSPVAVQKTGAPRLSRHRRVGVSRAHSQIGASVPDVAILGVPATRLTGSRFQFLTVFRPFAAATFHGNLNVAEGVAYLGASRVLNEPHQVHQVTTAVVGAIVGGSVASPAPELVLLPIFKLAADAGAPTVQDPGDVK